MAEEQELAAVEELLRMDAVWAEPPDDLQARIHAELLGVPMIVQGTSAEGDAAAEGACPDCGGPARVVDRFILYRESGPELHLRTVCRAAQHFERADE